MLGLMSAPGKQTVKGRIQYGGNYGYLDIFGELSIILVDWCVQLPLVGASSLWYPTPSGNGLSLQELDTWLAR